MRTLLASPRARRVAVASAFVAGAVAARPGLAADARCAALADARQAVMVLYRGDTIVGSGFVFGDRRTLATAEHVASAGANRAEDRAGNSYRLDEIADDQRRDLALFRLDRDADSEPLALAAPPSIGMEAFAIGHPRVFDGPPYDELTRWTVSGGRVGGADDDWISADATVYPGNSGGPLVDCEGRVLGVASHAADDLRVVFAGRAHHLDALRAGRDGPRHRIPVEPTAAVDLGGVLGSEQLGASVGLTWRSERGWLLRFTGTATSNAGSGDIFGSGHRHTVTAGAFGGIALRPFRGWHTSAIHVEPSLGLLVQRDTLRHPIIGERGDIMSETTRDLTVRGAAALRLHYGRWFVEPQITMSLDAGARLEWFITIGVTL